MRIVWSGVHERRKALELILNAFSLVINGKLSFTSDSYGYGEHSFMFFSALTEEYVLDVLGEGPETDRWKHLAQKLAVSERVAWHGWLPKDEAHDIVAVADVFVITSIWDLTSTVLLEALSAGKPVVCLDHCGFSDVVDDTCGIKVPIGNVKCVIKGFVEALVRLQDIELRHRLSEGARQKATEYSWKKKKSVLNRIYRPEWKKVLICVYACSPYRGSEPGMGWNYLKLIAEDREVWAIVEQEKWEKDIVRYLNDHPYEMKNVHFVFIRKARCRWLRKIWPPSYYWFYRIWHWRAYKEAVKLHERVRFDCAHQLNMVGFREPGYMWKLPVPFIWGPIGGLGLTDWRLLGVLSIGGKVEFFFRNVINWLHAHFLVRPRLAARKAAQTGSFITATGENQYEAKRLWGADSIVLCEIGT